MIILNILLNEYFVCITVFKCAVKSSCTNDHVVSHGIFFLLFGIMWGINLDLLVLKHCIER